MGLVLNSERERVREFVADLVASSHRRGFQVVAAAPHHRELGVDEWGEAPVDLVVAVGGDGTVLGAVRRARQEGCPVLGFNLGTIGFLAEAEPHELEAVLEALASKRFSVHPRLTLVATLPDGRQEVGVNDVVVEKIESQRLVALDVDVNGAPFFTYRADGLVIATPTGSTAYSFSAGGPLVDPGLEAIVMTPVAPHSLFGRSLVVPADQVIRCRVVAERPVRVSVDGREVAHLAYGDWVEVGRGEERVGFIELHDEPFPSVVSRKFRLR